MTAEPVRRDAIAGIRSHVESPEPNRRIVQEPGGHFAPDPSEFAGLKLTTSGFHPYSDQ